MQLASSQMYLLLLYILVSVTYFGLGYYWSDFVLTVLCDLSIVIVTAGGIEYRSVYCFSNSYKKTISK